MTPDIWLQVLLVSALAGAAGQVVRVVVGLKKLNDEASAKSAQLTDMIEPSRIVVSLLIGAVAGALTAITTVKAPAAGKPLIFEMNAIMAFAAAGYAGADAIEGLMSSFMPSRPKPAAANDATSQASKTDTSGGSNDGYAG